MTRSRAMRGVVAESIRGGALGFSTDRAGFHLGDGGRPVPSVAATHEETEALIRVTAEIGQGTVHVAAGEDYDWLYRLDLGRPINRSSILTYPPEARSRRSYLEKLDDHEARAAGRCRRVRAGVVPADRTGVAGWTSRPRSTRCPPLPSSSPARTGTANGCTETQSGEPAYRRTLMAADCSTAVGPRHASSNRRRTPTSSAGLSATSRPNGAAGPSTCSAICPSRTTWRPESA